MNLITISCLSAGSDPRFDAAMAIYRDAIDPSEQKSPDVLRAQIDDPRFNFLVGERDDAVVGFAIIFIPASRDFWLLEYMAVDETTRSSGFGSQLFAAATAFGAQQTDNAPGIFEVENPGIDVGEAHPMRRRLAFYDRKGCRVISGLDYILPPLVQGTTPPPMMLLIYNAPERTTLDKATLAGWLATLYCDVYGQPMDDPRLATMLAPLPDPVALGSMRLMTATAHRLVT